MFDKVKAVIWDFDGVIICSKVAEYESWRRVFMAFNCHLTVPRWIKIIDNPEGVFNPASILIKECKYGNKLDVDQIHTMRVHLYEALRMVLKPLPGVIRVLKECSKMGMLIGLASNGLNDQVGAHLHRLNLVKHFNSIKCRDDVKNKKPAPDVYLATMDALNIHPYEAIVIEDSPPGIAAAKAAGLYCIGVPNKITRYLNLNDADTIHCSLKHFSLNRFLKGI